MILDLSPVEETAQVCFTPCMTTTKTAKPRVCDACGKRIQYRTSLVQDENGNTVTRSVSLHKCAKGKVSN